MESRKKIDSKNDERRRSQPRLKDPLLDTMLQAITRFTSATKMRDFISGLKSDNSGIRGLAAGTLGQVVSESKLEGDASDAIPLLIGLLRDDNIGTRECAATALGEIGKRSDLSKKRRIASSLRDSAGRSEDMGIGLSREHAESIIREMGV